MRYRYLFIVFLVGATATPLLLWRSDWFQRIEERPFVDELLGNAEVTIKDPNELELVFVGDIMLSRHVGSKMVESQSWTLPFDDLAFELARADITFGNLESPFLDTGARVTEGLVFKAEKESIVGLVKAGFDVVSTANNHSLDQGITGLSYTKELLRQNGILGVGTGTTTIDAWQPAVFEVANTKVAFLAASYASVNDGGRGRNNYVARMEDLDFLRQAIDQLRSEVDIIIVSMHAGAEYTHLPNQIQKDFAHAAIDYGADVVVGHHPHWVQGLELYSPTDQTDSPRLILYSLGNFVFDQEWSQKTKEGLMVRLKIKDKKLDEAKLVPVILENYCCSRLANDIEAAKILRDINATSTIDLSLEVSSREP